MSIPGEPKRRRRKWDEGVRGLKFYPNKINTGFPTSHSVKAATIFVVVVPLSGY